MSTRRPPDDAASALTTVRIAPVDLKRLQAASRAPKGLPTLPGLLAMLGASLDDERVKDLGLSEQKSPLGGVRSSSRALGIEAVAPSARIIGTIFLHSEGHERFHVWAGDLGDGLSFSSTPALVRRARGAPSRSGPGWDRYDGDDGSVHFQYGDGGLRLVTLMAKGTAP